MSQHDHQLNTCLLSYCSPHCTIHILVCPESGDADQIEILVGLKMMYQQFGDTLFADSHAITVLVHICAVEMIYLNESLKSSHPHHI